MLEILKTQAINWFYILKEQVLNLTYIQLGIIGVIFIFAFIFGRITKNKEIEIVEQIKYVKSDNKNDEASLLKDSLELSNSEIKRLEAENTFLKNKLDNKDTTNELTDFYKQEIDSLKKDLKIKTFNLTKVYDENLVLKTKLQYNNENNENFENMSYDELLQTKEWKLFRDFVLKNKGYHCEKCGCNTKLNVHHTIYYKSKIGKLYLPWFYKLDDLKVLCENCHKEEHKIHKIPVVYSKH